MSILGELGKTFEGDIIDDYDAAIINSIKISENLRLTLMHFNFPGNDPTFRIIRANLNSAIEYCEQNVKNYYKSMGDR